jgi:Ran GTPase-activating protein (RanGAP) involved in mRNA processing and transport
MFALYALTSVQRATCDHPAVAKCTPDICRDPTWPYELDRQVLIIGDDLLAPSTYGGCASVSLGIAQGTALVVETSATAGASLHNGLISTQLGGAGVGWVVVSAGLNDLVDAVSLGTSLDLDTIVGPHDSGRLPDVIATAVREGASVVLVGYPIDARFAAGAARGQFNALMDRYAAYVMRRRELGESIFFVGMHDVAYPANASHFSAGGHRPSWLGGILIGSRVARLMSATLPPAEDAIFEATDAPFVCELEQLLASAERPASLAECTVLELQGALGRTALMESFNMTLNATVETLIAALADSTHRTPRLDTLLLGSNPQLAHDGSGRALAAVLRGHRTVRHLDLNGCDLTAADVSVVASALLTPRTLADGSRSPAALTSLALSFNPSIGAAGAAALAEALRENHILAKLHLSSCSIGAEGASFLGAVLAAGGGLGLEELTLDANGIGDEGAREIAEALRKDNHTISLELSGNGIGALGIEAIARAITPAPSEPTATTLQGWPSIEPRASALRSLNLHSNDAGDGGAAALAEMLRQNTKLGSLGLWDNGVSRVGAQALLEALDANRVLTRLSLVEHNDVASMFVDVAKRLDAAVARNAEAHALGGAPFDREGQSNHAKALADHPDAGVWSAYVLPQATRY